MPEVLWCGPLLLVKCSRTIWALLQTIPQGQLRTPSPKIREFRFRLLVYDVAHMLDRNKA